MVHAGGMLGFAEKAGTLLSVALELPPWPVYPIVDAMGEESSIDCPQGLTRRPI